MNLIARNSRELGAAIRRHRKRLKLTQAELAGRIRARQATISSLEKGQPAATTTLIDALAALDLELIVRPRSKASIEDILEASF